MTGSSKDSHHHKVNPSATLTSLKTPEQIKAEQRKNWTPEQWEEYKRRKEKERQLYKKRAAENGSSREHNKHNSHHNHSKPNNISIDPSRKSHESTNRKPNSSSHDVTGSMRKPQSSTNSPMKSSKHHGDSHTAKLSQHSHGKDRIYPDIHHRSTLSTTGVDNESMKNNQKKYPNSKLNSTTLPTKTLSPPPPPPIFGGGANKIEPPGKKSSLTTPPPPPSVPKYV